jgi:hypothetical protein
MRCGVRLNHFACKVKETLGQGFSLFFKNYAQYVRQVIVPFITLVLLPGSLYFFFDSWLQVKPLNEFTFVFVLLYFVYAAAWINCFSLSFFYNKLRKKSIDNFYSWSFLRRLPGFIGTLIYTLFAFLYVSVSGIVLSIIFLSISFFLVLSLIYYLFWRNCFNFFGCS